MSSADSAAAGQIAVVGMAARMPGAETLADFWRNLRDGVESVRRFTEAELRDAGESPASLADPDYVPARPVLANVDQFDAGFFGLSPQDASIMDPQHRLFLEVGWEALEHAGHDPARFDGSIGVFATCGMNTYMMFHLVTNRRIMDTVGEWLVRHTGNDMNFLATRLSYQLGLKGPSMNVQTACSSALVAIHMASQSLLNGECDMALAGGSVIALPQDRGYLYKKGEILSPDGHCRAFDARAEGTLFGSGAGVVVLRRLDEALADGDQILAVIRGSAVNNDGAMKVGYLAPSVEGQSRAVTEALAVSGIDAESISYIEAHGTATLVGDPIEITALTAAYRRYTDKRAFCAIGSLKSNVGHLGEAAGVASFIKTVLSLQHRQIPPNLHYETPNPQIDFDASPFFVNATLRDWKANGATRRAGVTALGAGGTNCHVIVEEPPQASPSGPAGRPQQLLVLSAKTTSALERASVNLANQLESDADLNLADAAFTLQIGRQVMPHRRAVVADTVANAARKLRSAGAADVVSGAGGAQDVAFLFPGGGAQYPGMAAGIYRTEAVFRRALDRSLALLQSRYNVHLTPLLFPTTAQRDAERLLEKSSNSILSIFAVEHALAELWMSWGIRPAAMTGHSVGEYAAACVAGVFSHDDALEIVHARGEIFDRLPAGAMISVAMPEAELRSMLAPDLSVAAVNGPALTVVSGPVPAVERFEHELTGKSIEARRLPITVAAHSSMLDPFLDEFRRRVERVRLSPPTVPFISNLSGDWIGHEAAQASYWVKHLRQPVRFADGLARLLERPGQVLLEVGPGRTLSSLARQQSNQPVAIVSSLRHRDEDVPDDEFLLRAAGRLWANGIAIDWRAFHGNSVRRRVPLPSYPFERRSHWVPVGRPAVSTETPLSADPVPTREPDIANWFYQPTWTNTSQPATSHDDRGDVLVFDNDTRLGESVIAELLKPPGFSGAGQPDASWRLEFPTRGETAGARLAETQRREPGPGEVEIAVHAAALNFADVLNVTGLNPDAPFGMECAGVVVRTGRGVTAVTVGDEVVAVGPGSFCSHLIRDARFVAKRPPHLAATDATTMPAVFMTAVYALEVVARLQPGERVLIHSASGGVGLAAVQIANARGAEIFATAGTPEKRAYLESLGIAHVFPSRSLEFVEGIRSRTSGLGVDVVLNALTGEALRQSARLLTRGGRFVELGVRELLTPEQWSRLELAPDVSYHPIELSHMLHEQPEAYSRLLQDVLQRVAAGALRPLPAHIFAISHAAEAFELMIHARHIGKVVLNCQVQVPRVWFVQCGSSFKRLGPSRFALEPRNLADYTSLFAELGDAARSIGRVLHLWNVGPGSAEQDVESQLALSFFAPVRLAQSIGRLELTQPMDLTLVSSGAQSIAGEPSADPLKITLQGPSRVIQRELPNLACRHVDILLPTTDRHRRLVAQQLATELRAPVSDPVIAYRGADRWVQSYVPVRIEGAVPPLRDDDAYLITGGTGGLGLEVAQRLAATGCRRLVLVSRTPLPPRSEWNTRVREQDQTAERLRKILACESLGAEVLVLAGDVTSPSDMRSVIAAARARFGRIAGAFHTAGSLADSLIQLKSDDAALNVLRPKVHGTLVLDTLLAEDPPDFILLFSSISAVLGLQGQVDYVAANAFLDAFARHRASSATRIVSVDWCAWREVGLATTASQQRHRVASVSTTPGPHPWLERRRRTTSGETFYSHTFARDRQWVIGEHVTADGTALMPGTGHLELVRGAISPFAENRAIEITRAYFHAPFVVREGATCDLEVSLRPVDEAFEWRIHSAAGTHATGTVACGDVDNTVRLDVAAIRERCPRHRSFAGGVLNQQFMAFGPRWANVTDIWYGEEEAAIGLCLPEQFRGDLESFRLHPALLDMATGGAQALIPGFDAERDFYVPFSYGRLVLVGALPAKGFSHVRLISAPSNGLVTFDITITDETGLVVAAITDFCMKRVTGSQLLEAASTDFTEADEPRPLDTSASLAEEMLRLGISSAEGLSALDRILASPGLSQVVVSSVNLGTWQALLAQQTRAAGIGSGAPVGDASNALLPGADIESRLAALWAEILGVTGVHLDDNFFELGGHSLLAVRLLTRIERLFQRALSVSDLFNAPTIAGIAALLRADTSASRGDEPELLPIARDTLRTSRKVLRS